MNCPLPACCPRPLAAPGRRHPVQADTLVFFLCLGLFLASFFLAPTP